MHYTNAQMNRMLAEWIYAGQSPGDLIWPAWAGALGCLCSVWCCAIPGGTGRGAQSEEEGRRLKGPEMVTVKEFNQWSGGGWHWLPDHGGRENRSRFRAR